MAQEEAHVVERDPTGRWNRYNELLGRGSFKMVYKGFDTKEGIEVAWNKVNTSGPLTTEDKERLYREVQILGEIQNPYIIRCLGGWRDKESDINFITELFTSGTLREFRRKHQDINMLEAVRRWGRNILQGLVYLHNHDPPIIHRDLKCDNIFVNGHSGEVKIADLGLATLIHITQAQTVIGTPEFMAPELYDEKYDELVDIYAFGMVLLELATNRFPYDECTNPAQIFKVVDAGVAPGALQDVQDQGLLAIIKACIDHNPQNRPNAVQLLALPFFAATATPLPKEDDGLQVSGKFMTDSDSVIELSLRLPQPIDGSTRKCVKFEFDPKEDTASSVAKELTDAFSDAFPDKQPSDTFNIIKQKIEYRVACVQRGDESAGPKKQSELTLVRLPNVNGTSLGVKVEPDTELPNVLRVELCCPDRRDLLWDITDLMQKLPLQVKNAKISTTEGGMAVDVFEVLVDEGCEIQATDLQNSLKSIIGQE
ncbi:serine threonine-protein kinase [Cymbomonas tetramitiformis]|uniref:non-specific serine/threonine protein kinase n=1 Tax=Cymbomonas tetramitiformis TaxID=36881 RepID=A0AAE0FBF5_9CHLO|nr:serine threonine-protein kinase [Cymbomonas tetramitiformis]|eukprot:gene13130-15503_t